MDPTIAWRADQDYRVFRLCSGGNRVSVFANWRVEVYSAVRDFLQQKSKHFAPRGDLIHEGDLPKKTFSTPRGHRSAGFPRFSVSLAGIRSWGIDVRSLNVDVRSLPADARSFATRAT